jgi:hypothetical protein
MEEKSFLREIKSFLFYTKWVWPLHRKLIGNLVTPRCRKCILSAHCSPLDSDGVCQVCREHENASETGFSSSTNETALIKQLSDLLSSYQGRSPGKYDALVLFSGGKDSCWLIHRLQTEFPSLRILLATIDNTVMSPVALKSIDRLVSKLGLDHLMIRPGEQTINKMFRYAFQHLGPNGCSGTVDQFDGDFFHDLGRLLAAQMKIPLLISGCSKTQVENILGLHHFESPREFELSTRKQVAGIELKKVFTADELKLWWDGRRYPESDVARVIYPFYAWNPEESFVRSEVIRLGFLQAGTDNPLLTNNLLIPMMAMVDMNRSGYSSFEPEFSKMVRLGKADPKIWRNIFEMSEYAAKTGYFVSGSVDQMLKRLNLTRQDVGLPR